MQQLTVVGDITTPGSTATITGDLLGTPVVGNTATYLGFSQPTPTHPTLIGHEPILSHD